jgi:hypothetical protein
MNACAGSLSNPRRFGRKRFTQKAKLDMPTFRKFLWVLSLWPGWAPLMTAAAASSASAVEQWGLFELALPGPTNANPFVDVRFSARFSQESESVEVAGFYDGGGTYRVRFMPSREGLWHYATSGSAVSLDAKTGEFRVTAPGARNHGPVRVAHTFHFSYADGSPYKQLGTTCYAWIHQSDLLQAQTLQTLAGAPFNKLRMCIFPKHYDWNTNEPSLYPFDGTPPGQWDFSRFNPKFFQHLEQRITALRELGIEADLILFHPYDGGHWGFDRMTAAADDRYLRYVIARLAAFRNVWWSLANEYDFMKEKREADFVRFGEIISANDPSHHLLSIHNGRMLFNHTLPWITHASIQNGSAVEDAGRAVLYRDVYRKPIMFDEVKYEGNLPKRWGNLSAEELVFRFWEATIAGTYAGHGEAYLDPLDVIWWAKGGVLHGESPARLAFLRQVLQDSPAEGIEPIDKWQNPRIGGQPGDYYLVYFGKEKPMSWKFELPKANLKEGMKFKAELLDTWNMTATAVDEVFTVRKEGDYSFVDKDGHSISLAGRRYVAIRIKRVRDQ